MTQMTIDQAMQMGIAQHKAGRLAEAQRIYRQVLDAQPNHAEAFHLLGIVASQSGKTDLAIELVRQAVALRPKHFEAYANLGRILTDVGRFEEARLACERAIEINPRYGAAYNNLGNALRELGRVDEAIAAFDRALALRPNDAEAHSNRGTALAKKGLHEQAIASYRRAIQLDPTLAMAHNNLGNALGELGQIDQAIETFRAFHRINPDFAESHYNLGNALLANEQIDEAIAEFRRATELKPAMAMAHGNLGSALRMAERNEEAIAAYDCAIQLKPDYAQAFSNRGIALHAMGRFDEAFRDFARAIELKPNLPEAYGNLGSLLKDLGKTQEALAALDRSIELNPKAVEVHNSRGLTLRDAGKLDEAVEAFQTAIRLNPKSMEAYCNLGTALKDCGLHDESLAAYRKAAELKPDSPAPTSNIVYSAAFHQEYDARMIFLESRAWSQRHERPLRSEILAHQNDRQPDRRLKIGYVSADFHEHVVGRNLLPLLMNHDHRQFEIFIYSGVQQADAVTEAVRTCSDHWRDVAHLNDQQLADQVRRDGIDILIDLTLHMAKNRLPVFARKPAPVQVTYLGYCGTTGLDAIDYRFSDPYMDPPQTDLSCYSEKTIRLPRTYWCYYPALAAEPALPPSVSNGFVTFGCLNNFAKVSPMAVDVWAKIMSNIPKSRLILHAQEGRHRQRVLQRFADAGINSDRIEFVGKQLWDGYVRTYGRVDVALDPFPYGGGITTCDSLWMGVPVVTLRGGIAVGRGGASVLSNVGLPEYVADTTDQYESIAVDLARDEPRRTELRGKLRGMMRESPLLDGRQFALDVEAAYRQMWKTWCARPS